MNSEKAHQAVRIALRLGKIVKPSHCQNCHAPEKFGTDGRSLLHGHHHLGYQNTLAVRWLCSGCHGKEDRGAVGERNPKSKLTVKAVSEIRRRYRRLNFNSSNTLLLATEYGVERTTIQRIVSNRSWIDAALDEKEPADA